jgi:hypothetical protein
MKKVTPQSRLEKTAHMGKRKVLRQLLSLFLILGIHTSGMMAEACLCGQSCSHGLQENRSEARVNSIFHKRCSGTNCKSCNVENGQTLKAANTSSPDSNFKIFDTAWIISVLVDYPSTNHILKSFCSSYAFAKVPSIPTYLKNLSLLF